jgi:Flp pilus assembly protein TadG
MVEFALVLPLLLFVLFAIVEGGLALKQANDATNIANEVARYAVVNQPPASGQTAAQWGKAQMSELDASFAGSEGGRVCVNATKAEAGQPVEVTVTFTHTWLPLLSLVSTEVRGKAVMRLESTPTTFTPGECA